MVDCDHSTGESAKVNAPATPPPKESAPDVSVKSREERQMSIAVQPAASAPKTAEQSETHHAGVGWPM